MKMIILILIGLLIAYGLYTYFSSRYYIKKAQELIATALTWDSYTITHPQGSGSLNVAVLGDSTAVGVGASKAQETYHYRFLDRFSQYQTITVRNFAKSGARVSDIAGQLERLDSADMVIMSIVGNDITHGTDKGFIETEMRKNFETLKRKTKQVIWITPGNMISVYAVPWFVRLHWSRQGEKVTAIVRRLKDEFSFTHVDLYHAPEDKLSQEDPKMFYAIDKFHPSAGGYAVWARVIERVYSMK